MAVSASVGGYLGVMLFLLIPIVCAIIWYYAEPGYPYRTYVTLFLGYYSAYGILLVVPIDIASCIVDRQNHDLDDSPAYDHDRHTLAKVYQVFFTTILVLGSAVLLVEEYYNTDGYFTALGRFGSSMKRMMIDNIPGIVVGCIVLGVLIGQHVVSSSSSALMFAAVLVTNTVYETMLMFLLGYAMVEFPRELWNCGDLDKYLLRVQMRASSEFKSIQEAQLDVSLCVSDVLKTNRMVNSSMEKKVVDAMAILVAECPPEFRSDRMGTVAADKKGQITVDTLAVLRTRLNTLKANYKMAQSKVEGTKILAYNLEDIVAAKNDPSRNTIHWSLYDTDSTEASYNWHIKYKPVLYRCGAVFLGILSIITIIGVICSMQAVDNNASIYYLATHPVGKANKGAIAFFILLTLGYTGYIVSWALFQAKIAGCMELVPFRTTPLSLSFNVRMNARLAAPLAFFYLGWLAENGIKQGPWLQNSGSPYTTNTTYVVFNSTTNTSYNHTDITYHNKVQMPSAFSNFYQMASSPVFQKTFGNVFPIMLFCIIGLFVTNMFNRILVLCKMDKYQFGAALVTEEQLREGKRQLQRHKKATERTFRREHLKSFIAKVTKTEDDGRGFFSSLFRGKAAKTTTEEEDVESGPAEPKTPVKEPQPLSAKVEKKSIKGAGGSWKPFYAEVRSPGYLHFYKDKKAASDALARNKDPSKTTDSNAVIVDLKRVNEFTIPDRKGKDNTCVDLELGHESIRIKFADHEEAVTWKHKLQDWKDWNNDYGSTYPYGLIYGRVDASNNSANSARPFITSAASATTNTKNPMNNPVSGKSTPDERQESGVSDFDFSGLHIDEDDDEDEKGVRPLMKGTANSSGGGGGSTSSWMKSKKKDTASTSAGAGKAGKAAPAAGKGAKSYDYGDDDMKPEMIEGWVEKKGGGRVKMGNDWQKRYLRIDEKNQCLSYYKTSSLGEAPAGMIDLKVVKDIKAYDKDGKEDFTRFNIDMEDKMYKFKVASQAEGKKWVDGLNEWRDHFLMNMA